MKYFKLLILISLFLFLACSGSDKPNNPVADNTTFGDGQTFSSISWAGTNLVFDSTASKKNLSLLYFWADWCPWCAKMESETFSDQTIIQMLGDSYNICKLDVDSDTTMVFMDTVLTANQIKSLYNFSGIPTIIILDSQHKYIGKISGYHNATTFYQTLNNYRVNFD